MFMSYVPADSPRKLSGIDLKPALGDVPRTLPMQFPVRGREALRLICEFQRNPGRLLFQGEFPAKLHELGTA